MFGLDACLSPTICITSLGQGPQTFYECPRRGGFPVSSPQMFVKCKTSEQKREQLGWGISKGTANWAQKIGLEEGLLEVLLREGLPHLPEPKILSNLPCFWYNEKQCFQFFSTPGGNHQCHFVHPGNPEITLSSFSMHCISYSEEIKAKKKSHRGPTTKGHIFSHAWAHQISILPQLTYFICTLLLNAPQRLPNI